MNKTHWLRNGMLLLVVTFILNQIWMYLGLLTFFIGMGYLICWYDINWGFAYPWDKEGWLDE